MDFRFSRPACDDRRATFLPWQASRLCIGDAAPLRILPLRVNFRLVMPFTLHARYVRRRTDRAQPGSYAAIEVQTRP